MGGAERYPHPLPSLGCALHSVQAREEFWTAFKVIGRPTHLPGNFLGNLTRSVPGGSDPAIIGMKSEPQIVTRRISEISWFRGAAINW